MLRGSTLLIVLHPPSARYSTPPYLCQGGSRRGPGDARERLLLLTPYQGTTHSLPRHYSPTHQATLESASSLFLLEETVFGLVFANDADVRLHAVKVLSG